MKTINSKYTTDFRAEIIKIATTIAGNVNKSPTAATNGVVTLSGSQPPSKLLNEMNIVTGSIIAMEIIPAIRLIRIKSTISIDGNPNITQITLAIIAKNKDKNKVNTNEEKILLINSSEWLNLGSIIPICNAVDNLEAKEPKIFPLIPIAPGIRTNNPGKVSRKIFIFPRITPAIKSPQAQINKAIRLSFKILSCSFKNDEKVE